MMSYDKIQPQILFDVKDLLWSSTVSSGPLKISKATKDL